MSVIAPVVVIVVMAVTHDSFATLPGLSDQVHPWRGPLIVAAAALIASATALMVRSVRRAEEAVMRHDGDLRLADAVSAASHGRGDARSIADAAAAALLGTLIDGVALTLLPDGGDAIQAHAGHSSDLNGSPDLDVPLREGERTVGHLRLWGPNADDLRAGVGPATLSALATQVAGAAQLATDVAGLHRRRDEGEALSAVLSSISRQSGTLPTLTSLAGYARDLLDADAAAVIVDPATASTVRFDSGGDVPQACSDGTTLLGVGLPDPLDPSTGSHANPIGCHHWTSFVDQEVSGPSGSLGRLWVGRRDPLPFTARDRSFLGAMAGLAGIALTDGQARGMRSSLVQVLGELHLRLRMQQTFGAVARDAEAAAEVDALADLCHKAYCRVREVTLGGP
ncbi:hypothetical protein G7070_05155 [Propioniciclava coleopterorum]|uniref:GAF domain-containing protein n=1 Tax=Propioniciclava coleopterorum TaxID=2714937 RepID=A0A6G7Y4M7_9ACTN|nr:hypothetical protein [Propioniciclava coleopterorum]QIK71772.1 hypothetical protein G7070_05155 [Propioniciclava coleopterorum]